MASHRKTVVLVLILVLVAGLIWYLESRKVDTGSFATDADIPAQAADPAAEKRISEKSQMYERAKEITTPDDFINTEPFALKDLIGKKVILVDFWTYSCINCQRTLPHLNSWHKAYEDDGLVIVGIHTPEFEFEKEYANVLAAVEKFDVAHPVVLDNDYSTWRSYNNRYWPRKYLIDIDGFIVYDHIGEGAYDETEKEIVEALEERAEVLGLGDIVEDDVGAVGEDEMARVRTPEIYFGSSRLEHLVNLSSETCLQDACAYTLPDEIPLHGFAFEGMWKIEKERARAESKDSSVTLHFTGKQVNLVAGTESGIQHARVFLDGVLIKDAEAGVDVEDGVVSIDDYTLYNLVELATAGEHVLTIEFSDPYVEVFTFTFG